MFWRNSCCRDPKATHSLTRERGSSWGTPANPASRQANSRRSASQRQASPRTGQAPASGGGWPPARGGCRADTTTAASNSRRMLVGLHGTGSLLSHIREHTSPRSLSYWTARRRRRAPDNDRFGLSFSPAPPFQIEPKTTDCGHNQNAVFLHTRCTRGNI